MRRPGILVVNRMGLLRRALTHGGLAGRVPNCNLSHEEVFTRYRGFDGDPWPEPEHPEFQIEDGLAEPSELPAVLGYLARLKCRDECDLIALAPPDFKAPIGFEFLGFDVGVFESEWSHFSSILHEVVYALEPELCTFAARLNDALLLDTLRDARDLLVAREGLLLRGADLEEGAECEAIMVYGRK